MENAGNLPDYTNIQHRGMAMKQTCDSRHKQSSLLLPLEVN